MKDTAARHWRAADRHRAAAEHHERAARFWEGRDRDRAELQREMAEYERRGAELERRWAELVDPSSGLDAVRAAELVTNQVRQGAKQLLGILRQSAEALEGSAGLADEHAQRREEAGLDPAGEREAADRARDTARRARSHAEKWGKTIESHGE